MSAVPRWMKITWITCGIAWVGFIIPAWTWMLFLR